jgi:hypothetical protein
MPAEDNTKIVTQHFWDEVVIRGNLNVVDRLFAPEWALHEDRESGFCDLKELSGPAVVRELIETVRNCLSDLKVAVEDQIDAEADRVITRVAVSGSRNHSASSVCRHGFSS